MANWSQSETNDLSRWAAQQGMLATDSGKPSLAKQAQEDAVKSLLDERSRQVTAHSITHDDNHGPGDWLVLIRDDLRKAEAAWISGNHDEYLRRLRYIGALSLAATERELRREE